MSSNFLPSLSQPNSTYLWLQTCPSLDPSPFYFQCSPLKAFPQLALLLFQQTASASILVSASIFWHRPHMPRLTGGSFLLIWWPKHFVEMTISPMVSKCITVIVSQCSAASGISDGTGQVLLPHPCPWNVSFGGFCWFFWLFLCGLLRSSSPSSLPQFFLKIFPVGDLTPHSDFNNHWMLTPKHLIWTSLSPDQRLQSLGSCNPPAPF